MIRRIRESFAWHDYPKLKDSLGTVAKALGCSRTKVWEFVANGSLETDYVRLYFEVFPSLPEAAFHKEGSDYE